MEKCLKVAELATLWGVSVPTTWNRVRKEGLETIIKKDENGKDINYINIPDEILNKYINNPVNNQNNVNNNVYYEDLLSNNNINNSSQSNNNNLSSSELFDKLVTLNNEYNDRLEQLNKELITSEKQRLLLEDKASREGLYLKEINELKKDNEKLKTRNKTLFTVLTVIITVLITACVMLFIVNNIKSDSDIKKEPAQQEILKNPAKPVKK